MLDGIFYTENKKQKKILLVNANLTANPYPAPPIGVCLVASSLPEKYEVKIYDATFDYGKSFEKTLEEENPWLVGVGIRNVDDMSMEGGLCFIDSIADLFAEPLKKFKKQREEFFIVLGGAGYSIFPREIFEIFEADFGIIGEGEASFAKLINCISTNENPRKIPGLVYKAGDEIRINLPKYGEFRRNFSRIYRWVDYSPYTGRGAYPIQTKRGCPFCCTYCTYPLIEGGVYRLRSPDEVVDEIEDVAKTIGNGIMFEIVDSTFGTPSQHSEEICRQIIKRKLNIKLRTMGLNPAFVTDRLLGLMKDAGFEQIDCTPDTASQYMLLAMGKNFKLEELQKAAVLIKNHNLPAMWFFIFGGPGETVKTIEETFTFFREFISPDDMIHMQEGLRIYPQTALYKIAVKENVVKDGESLLYPRFYVSPSIGKERLKDILNEIQEKLPNALKASESTPSIEMLKFAIEERKKMGLKEPMFRTLLRLRKQGWR